MKDMYEYFLSVGIKHHGSDFMIDDMEDGCMADEYDQRDPDLEEDEPPGPMGRNGYDD